MVRKICKDTFFLSRKAEPATASDLEAAQDLLTRWLLTRMAA